MDQDKLTDKFSFINLLSGVDMTEKQKKKFKSLCRQMAKLMKEMEPDHSEVQFFIDDGTPYLLDPQTESEKESLGTAIIASGIYWHRSGGGGF